MLSSRIHGEVTSSIDRSTYDCQDASFSTHFTSWWRLLLYEHHRGQVNCALRLREAPFCCRDILLDVDWREAINEDAETDLP
ncbi:hypothetical protein K1719_028647 [Acacia pycnantha]|nr:hypothetical protein K1719_041633 [Acacia pycnantha]KAI9090794.1 hypothetical protein K1719_028647 [Acacia pycnantha]